MIYNPELPFAPPTNSRGRYKCPFCDHKTWKQHAAARNHIVQYHKAEAELAQAKARTERLQREKVDLERKLAEAQKPKPEAKKEKEVKRYSATVYCTNCRWVSDVLIPEGVTIKEGDCVHCRVRQVLMPVARVNANRSF